MLVTIERSAGGDHAVSSFAGFAIEAHNRLDELGSVHPETKWQFIGNLARIGVADLEIGACTALNGIVGALRQVKHLSS